MSKLEKLIAELCPDGVKYYTLNTVCNVYDGTHKTPKYTDSGIKFASVENIADPYATEKYISISDYEKYKIKPQRNDLLMTRIGSIGVCTVLESDEPLAYYVSLALLRPNNNELNSRYLKYAIESLHCRKELRKRTLVNAVPIKINMGDIGKITLPVPPLPVQREIVRILDNFTELTEGLNRDLAAELTARKKQYAYYRDKLLTFGDVRVGVTSDVIRRTLGEVCKISAGGDAPKNSMSKQKTEKYSVPIISNGIGENALYGYTDAPKVEEPAVTVAARGTIGYAEYRDYPFYPIIRLLTAIPKDSTVVNTKYLYYCLQGKQYSVPMGGIPQLTAPELKKVEIPIPSLDVQNRIVQVLDNFDAICTDLNIGLPAEIEARQKQYEFYRDQLLTFAAQGETILTDRQTDRRV